MNFGIICEFNPFHEGHAYLFEQARALGAKNIICAMSGASVQRGELAIFDKYLRAESAIDGGAELVLELPFPWSSASAEYFAEAGVKILAPLCDAIIFGSECGDAEVLKKAALEAVKPSFTEELNERKKSGEGAASAYFSLLYDRVGVKLSSNDLLGVEYMKAAIKNNFSLNFYTVKRKGSAYRDKERKKGELPSASAIRSEIMRGEEHPLLQKGELIDERLLDRAYLAYLRLLNPKEAALYAENKGGVAERIHSLSLSSSSFEELLEKIRTKRYTDAKLRRATLFAITQVTEDLLRETPKYTYLLGASRNGRKILSSFKKAEKEKKEKNIAVPCDNEASIKIITKPADAPEKTHQHEAEKRLYSLLTLAKSSPSSVDGEYRKKAVIK